MRVNVKLHTGILTTAALITLAACNPAPAADAPAAAPPPAAEIAAPAPQSGPAAENTTETLSTTPMADPAAAPAPPAPALAATPPAAAASVSKEELANGAGVYARLCAMCHGPTGAGTQMGVALTAGFDAAAVQEKVTKGVIKSDDKMPALGAALSADELDDVAIYVEAGLPQ
jgi:2-oxoglutarate dehydrogenase E2 component (dihydrolipoamide succinyltransferase)